MNTFSYKEIIYNMPKRAQRRHHEQRVKDKFRRIVKRWWSGLVAKDAEYMRWVEESAVRRAHHNKCSCWMCHNDRYDRLTQKILNNTRIKEGIEDES